MRGGRPLKFHTGAFLFKVEMRTGTTLFECVFSSLCLTTKNDRIFFCRYQTCIDELGHADSILLAGDMAIRAGRANPDWKSDFHHANHGDSECFGLLNFFFLQNSHSTTSATYAEVVSWSSSGSFGSLRRHRPTDLPLFFPDSCAAVWWLDFKKAKIRSAGILRGGEGHPGDMRPGRAPAQSKGWLRTFVPSVVLEECTEEEGWLHWFKTIVLPPRLTLNPKADTMVTLPTGELFFDFFR